MNEKFVLEGKKPEKPEEFRARVEGTNNVILSWLPPKQCGGSPVTKYIIETLFIPDDEDGGYADWEFLGATSNFEYKMTAKASGEIHHLRIFSKNSYGTSEEAMGLTYKHFVPEAVGRISFYNIIIPR